MTNFNPNNLPPFYEMQTVVATENSTPGFSSVYKKGDEFVVSELKKCQYGFWNMSFIGRPSNQYNDCRHFAPLHSTFETITYKEVINIEQPLICKQ